jgi:outer membrane murein-binding lipoprotein Lpp
MKLQAPLLAAAACGAFALPGCGSDSEKSDEANVSDAKAIQEIAATRVGLDHAVKQLRAGDAKAAEDTVAETYLQHFELVEGPLDEVDHELNEELEEAINEELRDKIKGGATPAEVSKLVDSVKADLQTAEAKLR